MQTTLCMTEDIIEFQVGNGQTVLSTVFLTGQHTGEFAAVAHQVTKMTNLWRRDKASLNHIVHNEITDPFGIFAVGLVSLLRLCVLWMRKGDHAGCFKYIENRNPILAGRFHINLYLANQLDISSRPLEKEEK